MSKARELADSYTDSDVEAYADSQALGVGQTWQDMTASRAANVTYTNTTGRPIDFSVLSGSTSGDGHGLKVDGVWAARAWESGYGNIGMSATVPSGSTYLYVLPNGGLRTSEGWSELR